MSNVKINIQPISTKSSIIHHNNHNTSIVKNLLTIDYTNPDDKLDR